MSDTPLPVFATYESPYTDLQPEKWPQHQYILSIFMAGQDQGVPTDTVNLPFVSHVQMQKAHSVDRAFTLSSVFEQHSGFRERTFSLTGRSGDQPEHIAAFMKLRNFVETYAQVKAETENAFSHQKRNKLVLNFSWEREGFECTLTNFSYQREAGSNTNSYVYSMSLVTTAVWGADRAPVTPPLAKPIETPADVVQAAASTGETVIPRETDSSSRMASLTFDLEEVTAKLDYVEDVGLGDEAYLQSLRDKKASLEAELEKAKQDSVRELAEEIATVEILENPIRSNLSKLASSSFLADPESGMFSSSAFSLLDADGIKDVVTAAENLAKPQGSSWLEDVKKFVGGADVAYYNRLVTTLTTPVTELAKIKNIADPVTSGLSSLASAARTVAGAYYEALPQLKASAFGTVSNIRSSIESLKQSYGMLEDMTSKKYWNELGSGWSDIWGNRRSAGVYLPTVNTQVVATPTPSGVNNAYDAAQTLLGDRSRWREIVAANGLQDPYTMQNGAPFSVGLPIMIPVPAAAGGAPSNFVTYSGLFGSDLLLKDGDLVLRGDGSFATVDGQANFEQNLRHRLQTPKGSNRAFPNFGLNKYLNERQSSNLLAQFWADVRGAVLRDRRVKALAKVAVFERNTKFIADLVIELPNLSTRMITLEYTPPL
jgi:hypothetical protein